jgi:SPP1 family predicted phage head-tail adaptor
MSEATEAIEDIVEALNDYGSSITLRDGTVTAYDPYTGPSVTDVDTPLKAFISLEASRSLSQQFDSHTYDLAIKTYHTSKITKEDQIIYDGQVFRILYVSSKILQDTTLIYELLIVR